jgi:hypothetical protein
MNTVAELREMTFQFSAKAGDAARPRTENAAMMDVFIRTSPDLLISLLIGEKFNPSSHEALAEVSPLSDGRVTP